MYQNDSDSHRSSIENLQQVGVLNTGFETVANSASRRHQEAQKLNLFDPAIRMEDFRSQPRHQIA